MPWATTAAARPFVAGCLGVDAAELAARWDPLLDAGVSLARREMEEILEGRGYSPATVQACDWAADEHARLTAYAAVLDGGSLPVGDADLALVERRRQAVLDRVARQPVKVNGQIVFPDRLTPAGDSVTIAGGTLAAAADAYGAGRHDVRRVDPNDGY